MKNLIIFFIVIYITACGNSSQPGIDNGFKLSSNPSVTSLTQGRHLAKKYCQSCHIFPEPNLLNKESWERYVLPTMGYRLGLYHQDASQASEIRQNYIENGKAGELVIEANIFPEKPSLLTNDFQKITDYYLSAAPEKPLISIPQPEITPDLKFFQIKPVYLPYRPASTTLVKINPENQNLYLGTAQPAQLVTVNAQGKYLNALPMPHPPSFILFKPPGFYTLNMGSFFPSDAPAGNLNFYTNSAAKPPQIILKGLQRPVQIQLTDLNQDENPDWLVCEFGNLTGSLSWYENLSGHKYLKHSLKTVPGATRAYVLDINQDLLPDIIALMAQGNEGIFIFYNQGQGKFREEQVLQFAPAMGSSYFELVDFNQDGYTDILYTAGDNADFNPILKRYHGIRIYLNNGQNQFNEVYFFPQNGAYKATAADFDGDGDMDIAAIAYFARFKENLTESFVYLQNLGQLKFKAQTFKNSNQGRWLTMDQGDLDKDGDTDLVLGAFALKTILASEAQNQNWINKGPAALILLNKTK